jgi:hypothetical protein
VKVATLTAHLELEAGDVIELRQARLLDSLAVEDKGGIRHQ